MLATAPFGTPPEPLNALAASALSLADQFSRHRQAAIWLGAFCLWVSASLIGHMWLIHRSAPLVRKLLWSFALLVPLLGWLFYAALFCRLGSSSAPGHVEHGRDAPYIGGGEHF